MINIKISKSDNQTNCGRRGKKINGFAVVYYANNGFIS
jgi:hypothetical protein